MKLVLHRHVRSDVDEIMHYDERAGHPELAQDFYSELRGFILEAARRPGGYHFFKADLRRVNLKRFPYHVLFRVVGNCVRILVVRHHRRHPDYGLDREAHGTPTRSDRPSSSPPVAAGRSAGTARSKKFRRGT